MENASENDDDPVTVPVTGDGWIQKLIIYAARNPWEFCWYLLLGLSPFFCVSAYLSWKLAKAIEAQEKEKNRRNKRNKNISKVKRGKND